MSDNEFDNDITWNKFIESLPCATTFKRLLDCFKACSGMENPEKEIAEKDAEIARLKQELHKLTDRPKTDKPLFMRSNGYLCEEIKRLKFELDHANDEIARLKSESTEMLNIAVEIATEKLRSDNAALRSVLKKHEWAQVGTRHRADFICVDCGWNKAHGHAPGCGTARLLEGEKK